MISLIISPHGFGHLTRQIALGRELIRQRQDIRLNYICSQNHIDKFENLIKINKNVVLSRLPDFTPLFMMKNLNIVDIKSSIDNFENALNIDTDIIDREWIELWMEHL